MHLRMGNPISFENAVDQFGKSDTVFVAAHIQPDGDCIGSALGLTWALRHMGKTVTVSLHDHVSKTFDFLPGYADITAKLPGEEQLYVYLDGSSADRYGPAFDPARFGPRAAIGIDHHATNTNFAPLNYVDVNAASCAEIVYRFVRALQVPLDTTIAQCLLTGIVTDTLGFRTTSTTTETLHIATELVRAGGSISTIIERVFNQVPLASLRLRGEIFSHAQLDGPILWAQITQKQLRSFGVENGTGGVINQLLSVDQSKIAVTFIEKEDGKIEVGLRARPGYDVSGVAARLGGGGHKQASGATVPGPMDAARASVLAEIKKSLEEKEDRQ
jgi:bifunctional oligoribonuclease and PAP phosphatase NrnA